ncbi:polynucleotide adenylyltransferase [Entophlyctis luteolus]|nr:polynucleotide adenylyltransferase [Entophlyctis luteolus]
MAERARACRMNVWLPHAYGAGSSCGATRRDAEIACAQAACTGCVDKLRGQAACGRLAAARARALSRRRRRRLICVETMSAPLLFPFRHATVAAAAASPQTHGAAPRPAAAGYLGVTPPLSSAPPSPDELAATDRLVALLHERKMYETLEEAQKREVVLAKLDSIFKAFVRRISLRRNLPESIAAEAGGKIFTFGSYRLGVHGQASDIDTLCVAPKHVQREDFFTDMLDMLKERPEVSHVQAVTDAFVPVIKFEFSGIEIDLLCARLALPAIPDDLELADDNLLKNLDERCVRSLNGSRVTDEILRLVPNVDTFRTALRCIKLWAKQRAVYSNVMGFFGGVAWAIAVARVCQLYPNAAAGVVVNKFFNIMLKWQVVNWPQPVILKPIEDGPINAKVWNPRIYAGDKAHRMPIITPAYPCMCSTHNISASTFRVTMEEFKRGAQITQKILAGSANWTELIEKHDFFDRYKYYLQIIASSDTEERHLRWSGLVESKVRQLVMKLETSEAIMIAHPYIKSIDRVTPCKTLQEGIDAAVGLYPKPPDSMAEQEQKVSEPVHSDSDTASTTVPDSSVDNGTIKTVRTSTFYIGLQIAPKSSTPPPSVSSGGSGARRVDISWPTQEFVNLVKMWEKYEPDTMGIVVQHIKSSALPPELRSESARNGGKATTQSAVVKKRSREANGDTASTPGTPTTQPALKKQKATDEVRPADDAGDSNAEGQTTTSRDEMVVSTDDSAPKAVDEKESVNQTPRNDSNDLKGSKPTTSEDISVGVKPHYSGLGSGIVGNIGGGGIKVTLGSSKIITSASKKGTI